MIRLTDVVKHLIIINILVYAAAHLILPDPRVLSLYYPDSEYFQPFQLVSHMFMHSELFYPNMPSDEQGSIFHLLFNMATLFFLGPMVETALGPKRFLIMYLAAGFGAMLCHMGVWYLEVSGLSPEVYALAMQEPNFRVVGASGAVYGVLAAFAFLFPNIRLMLLFPPIPIKAKYLALGLIVIDLFSGISGISSGIAHFAHLGGAITGFLMVYFWRRRR